MKLLIAFFVMLFCNFAYSSIVTFDDVPSVDPVKPIYISSLYNGLKWNNFIAINGNWMYSLVGYNGITNGTVSGSRDAENLYGGNASVSSDHDFNFIEVYFTAVWNIGLTIDVKGFQNGIEMYDKSVIVNTDIPTKVDFNFSNIDSLIFSPSGGSHDPKCTGKGTYFAMDNFSFIPILPPPPVPASAPEPTMIGLFLIGFGGIIGCVTLKKKKKI